MTLAIAFKSPEGIVLAADSRVTLQFQQQAAPQQGQARGGVASTVISSAYYDHAIKLLRTEAHKYAAAVTHGVGVINPQLPRTAESFMPEFEASLPKPKKGPRLTTFEFASHLGSFFDSKWKAGNMPANVGDMAFLVGGYDPDEPYGHVYEVKVPSSTVPIELNKDLFGLSMGGQTEIASRLFGQVDAQTMQVLATNLKVQLADVMAACAEAQQAHGLKIPYQFLPLQDCVDLSILLIKATSDLMKYVTDLRGVGGAIDVATITKARGYQNVQFKCIQGER